MANQNVSHLNFVDEFYISALLHNEEHPEVFSLSDAQYAEELQLQEALMGCLTISQMKNNNPSSVLTTEAPPQPNHREAGQSSHSFCDICVERKESDQMFATDKCAHSYCSDCISKYVAAKIQDSITVVTCPELDCKTVLEIETCRVKLNKGVIDLWEDALCVELISGFQRFYCPYKDCSAMLIVENEANGEAIRESECPFCHRLFCVRCYVPWHSGVECEVFQSLNEDERGREDLMVMELARDKKWTRCPRCKFFVERTTGCPHMSCRCGFQFCYGCGADWTSSHGGCQRN